MANKKPSQGTLVGAAKALIEIGEQRANHLREIKKLLEAGNDPEALDKMRDFLAVTINQKENQGNEKERFAS